MSVLRVTRRAILRRTIISITMCVCITQLLLPVQLRCSIRYTDALLRPQTRHFVINHRRQYSHWKRPWIQQHVLRQQHQQFVSTSSDHDHNDDRNSISIGTSSNSLLFDDLLNDILKNRQSQNDTTLVVSNDVPTSISPSQQQHSVLPSLTDVSRILKDSTSSIDKSNHNHGWRCIDWATTASTTSTTATTSQSIVLPSQPPPSTVDIVMIRDRLVYIKRDDQVRSMKQKKREINFMP